MLYIAIFAGIQIQPDIMIVQMECSGSPKSIYEAPAKATFDLVA